MSPPNPVGPIAYLTGHYPKASHTFIQREIASLRKEGVEVQTLAMRRPTKADLIGPEEVAAEAETFYVVEALKNPITLLKAHAELLARAPGRWFRTLALAFKTARPGLKGSLKQMIYFLEAGIIARQLSGKSVAHLHNHFADSSANVAMLSAELADIPFSFTLHGPAELFEPESWHLGEKIARAAFTVCISDFARSQAMLFSDPSHWDRLKIIHCGVDPARYDVPPPQTKDGLDLVFVGRLTQIKGLRVLFEALESLRATHPNVTLTLIGDGDDRAHAETQAKRLGGITLLGFQSQAEVAEALARADALVLPSFAEGVPVVLMEAMASARPVICTQVAGVSELVEHGVSGFIVPPGNADRLAQAIKELADAPDLAAMGEAGRTKVAAEFNNDIEAARLLTHFRGDI